MTAIIDGVTVIGKPEEINELINLRQAKIYTTINDNYTDNLSNDDINYILTGENN